MRLATLLAVVALFGVIGVEVETRWARAVKSRENAPRIYRDRAIVEGASVGQFTSPDGKESLQCPLPSAHHIHNSVGTDGAGLCVDASAHHTGVWQADPAFAGLFDYAKRFPGGSYPEKF